MSGQRGIVSLFDGLQIAGLHADLSLNILQAETSRFPRPPQLFRWIGHGLTPPDLASRSPPQGPRALKNSRGRELDETPWKGMRTLRSEEHTSELQSRE